MVPMYRCKGRKESMLVKIGVNDVDGGATFRLKVPYMSLTRNSLRCLCIRYEETMEAIEPVAEMNSNDKTSWFS